MFTDFHGTQQSIKQHCLQILIAVVAALAMAVSAAPAPGGAWGGWNGWNGWGWGAPIVTVPAATVVGHSGVFTTGGLGWGHAGWW